MSAERVFLGLGSNLLDPRAQLAAALALLDRQAGITVVARSLPYRTSPWGLAGQPAFINAVAELRTRHPPRGLLRVLQRIESDLGRIRDREVRWGPRVIDLDLLAFGDRRLAESGLQVPHPRLAERRFVLAPWAEIGAEFEPPDCAPVAELLRRCADPGTVEALEWPLAAAETGERP